MHVVKFYFSILVLTKCIILSSDLLGHYLCRHCSTLENVVSWMWSFNIRLFLGQESCTKLKTPVIILSGIRSKIIDRQIWPRWSSDFSYVALDRWLGVSNWLLTIGHNNMTWSLEQKISWNIPALTVNLKCKIHGNTKTGKRRRMSAIKPSSRYVFLMNRI